MAKTGKSAPIVGGGKDYGVFIATAYGPPWGGIEGGGQTSTGVSLPSSPTGRVGPPYIVAVDPSVIPYHTKLNINPNPANDPGIVWSAEDTGGAIKGNRIDFLDLTGRAHQNWWGRRPVHVTSAGSQAPTGVGSAISRPGGANDTGAAVDKLFQAYQEEINMPRRAPKNGGGWKAPFDWWLTSFRGKYGAQRK